MKLQAIVYLEASRQAEAQALADSYTVPMIAALELGSTKGKQLGRFLQEQLAQASAGCVFLLDAAGLALYALGSDYDVSIRADFHGDTTTYRRNKGGGNGQMIAKAVGLRAGLSPSVLDATAGLGGDAFVLASLGCKVTLLERVPIVRSLLLAGFREAEDFARERDPALAEILLRMRLVSADAQHYMSDYPETDLPDVIYLDPMFPDRGKRAMVKKEMRVFHQLVGGDMDSDRLLESALSLARHRVVVKRPRHAPRLNGLAPSHVLEGKRNRYDVYTLRKI
ncbi:MAG: 16S rRNA (guanine1516-N2)-methyltransferase [Lentimonas sp.]